MIVTVTVWLWWRWRLCDCDGDCDCDYVPHPRSPHPTPPTPPAVEYELFEEAFHIYKKFQLHTDAMRVLLGNLNDLDRALEYATKASVVVDG